MAEELKVPDYSYEDTLPGQQMTKEERYTQMVEYMNTVQDYNFHNGIKLIEITDNYASCRVELTPEVINSQGMAHGGIVFSICDVAAGFAAASIDRRLVTQGATINYLRPAAMGSILIAKAEPVKIGKTISVVEVRVYDEKERLIAQASFTVFYT